MANPTYQELEAQIDACMLIDRFRLRRDLKKKQQRNRVVAAIGESRELADSRRAAVPVVRYPEQLPVSQRSDEIKKAIVDNQVIILAGETGSGKTTQLPKICLEAGRGIFGLIGHTQPRRVAARTIAWRLAEELSVKVGNEVGYQVRFTDETKESTLIKVMTDGVLLAETQHDRFLDRYDTIIVDEAHERSLNIDFLLGYLKRILPKRPDLKVIITSATIDVERFSKHFNNAPVIEVSGRTYPVEVWYRPIEETKSDDSDERINEGIVDAVKEVVADGPGDVLVFLPGEREIREASHSIRKAGMKDLELLPLYSRLSVAEQNKAFQPHSREEKVRRVVLATNVAETSLTVPGIRYVVDPGLARVSRYSFRSKVQQLPTEAVSRASADQRKGRCGRVSDGICVRLYSEEDYEARPEFTEPEILRTNLASVILQMLHLRLGDISRFPFVERPNQRQINDGFSLLFELGAVDKKKQITRLGKHLARFPVDLRFARMLMAAARTGCLKEVLVIASALTIQDPRERPLDHQQAADQAHQQYWHERSDFLTLFALWNDFEQKRQDLSQNQLRKFCRQQFLSYPRMREWRDIHRQLLLLTKELGFKQNQKPADYGSIHKAILTGLLGHVAEKSGENDYRGARNRKEFIFPGSSQFARKPKWIVSSELVETSRLYARTVADIDRRWIEPLAGHLVTRDHHDPYFDPDKGLVLVKEDVSLYNLPIVLNRDIDFGAVDEAAAREIFIEQALVDRQLKTDLKFFKQNMKLIREIEKLESKIRKRDILVESRALYDFYDSVLPPGVSSELDLRQYVNTNPVAAKTLVLSKEELTRREAELSEQLYPDQLDVASTALPLQYKFEPGVEDDGVSVDVPLVLLNQVSSAQLDWLVPGFLREKCLALVKSLPKSLRRNFVPAPDYVDRVLEDFEYDGRELSTALADRLFRISGVKVEASDFQEANIDTHLTINVRVVDEKGKTIKSGRDLAKLVEELDVEVASTFGDRGPHQLERSGVVDWEFGEIPETVELVQGNLKVKGYAGLVDEGESVGLKVFNSEKEAAQAMSSGLLRLFLLRLKDQEKYLLKNIEGFDEYSLYYATRGNSGHLAGNIVTAVFNYVFIEDQPIVRTEAGFLSRLERKSMLFETLSDVSRLVGSSLKSVVEIEGRMKDLETPGNKACIKDMAEQIEKLFGADFPRDVPQKWLRQYPRYLKALGQRCEKLSGGLDKDLALMEQLKPWLQKLESVQDGEKNLVTEYRWMCEEYRVSLFAQSLGTSVPVSDKRLAKTWEAAMGRKS